MRLARRKSDGKVFKPSFPDNYNEAAALAELFSGKAGWYFRGVEKRPWLFFFCRWAETGEIWEPKEGHEFEVFDG